MQVEPPKPPHLERKLTSWSTLACIVAFSIPPVAALVLPPSNQAKLAVIHVAVVFGVLLVAFRVLGKRELSRLSPFEFVTLMLVPELVSEVVQGGGELSAALVGLSTLFLLVQLVSLFSHRFHGVQRLVEAEPTILVANGKLREREMNDERIAPDELFSEMHKQGLERLSQVKWAILEGSGHITFVPKKAMLAHGCTDEVNDA
jgi:uncharacterized membrane protein YcaP (DUF421 family)